jgi:hypothetical protein
MEDTDKFTELFDMTKKNKSDSDVDAELVANVNNDQFEKQPAEQNFDQFKNNLKSRKEDLGEVKAVDSPEEETSIATEEEIQEVQEQINEIANDPDLVIVTSGPQLKSEEENADKDNSEDVNGIDTDNNSGDKVKMDSQTDIATKLEHFHWDFKTDNPKFSAFYTEKEKLVRRITQNDILPFSAWRDEMKDAKVDLSTVEYDLRAIHTKMVLVQDWKDRVQEMLIRANGQYFLWRRFTDLLRGYLAKIGYEKPAEKFKGVIYQHMGDVEFYFAELESIREDLMGVVKNLEAAAVVLNRQLSIILYSKDVPTKYEHHVPQSMSVAPVQEEPQRSRVENTELSSYDTLSSKIVEDNRNKIATGSVGWDYEAKKR